MFGELERETIVKKGEELLQKYMDGKKNLDKRIVENEQWYKMLHWEQIRDKSNGPQGASAWLFNSLANKHADAMDNYPQPSFLPREEGDKEDAEVLSKIVPVILKQNNFEQVYNDAWHDKLKSGTGVYKVFWDKEKDNGIGDIGIVDVDVLNLFWEPGVKDIQKSPNLFHIELMDREALESSYPDCKFKGSGDLRQAKYIHDDTIDTTDKCMVVDWYYKKHEGGRETLQFIKFCEGNLLYATEQEEGMENGLYAHGRYPYEFDVLFPEKDSPAGFGYVDIMKDAQISIDNMWISFEKNVKWCSEPRYFSKDGNGINMEQFADLKNTIVNYTGDIENIRPIQTAPVGGIATNLYQMKIDELKETSSNRDFSQGSTASGVTAASAIAALQEAGSKTSRDMIKSAYRTFERINILVVELIREFYDEAREFRITGKRGDEFIKYSNENLKPTEEMLMGQVAVSSRKPIFDINITSQKNSPFSRVAQNELAKELYGAGLFNPQLTDQALICLEMMDFEGREEIIRKVSQNGTMLQQLQQMQMQIQQMAEVITALTGRDMVGAVNGGGVIGEEMPPAAETSGGRGTAGYQGAAGNKIAERAKERTRERTTVG
nr:MAG TPA_asm: portal protein [Caudoviricetes sp.]